ncbi:3-carboxy-cis,cis-muconate cycloisomerase [Roseiterribacter gracilis]|uniref:3-carboxy-cis,cis-muconate cycloisomerase n=1 Tax=Roseiterribacter gracilis TaxID=2812848 RepID=A0A8S8XC89_9PROT|nr:3-carboxy-cis,cis-muconate cycloisomerase [Rhodospirillales bacterium TMPK1]
MTLFDPLFHDAVIDAIFDDFARVQAMLDFEAALARAEASVGVIPAGAVGAIETACRVDRYDLAALAEATALAGNPAIPLIKRLTENVADRNAARWVHYGSTSQDVIDTGLVLQMRAARAVLLTGFAGLEAALAKLAQEHRDTLLPARTLLQQALPTTFGLKAAGWLTSIRTVRARLDSALGQALQLQFGGAAGTLASLNDRGLVVAEALARELDLALPVLPWHARREQLVDVGLALALAIGALGKVARDVVLLMQTEVGEAFEPAAPGRGGSSAMPHKRNPVAATATLAAALRAPGLAATLLSAMPQEQERGVGGWHAEWEVLPELFRLAGGALRQMRETCAGLEIDRARMDENLSRTHGLLFAEAVTLALAPSLGRSEAHALVEEASRKSVATATPLLTLLQQDARVTGAISPAALASLFDPRTQLGSSAHFIDRALR